MTIDVDQLLAALTLDDKVALLAGDDQWHTPAVPGVPPLRMSDGPAGVRGTGWNVRSSSFPCATALGASFDPALVARRRRGARPRSPFEERARVARPHGEPASHAHRRAQLRVHERGPRAHLGAGRPVRARCAVPARRVLHQALRRQRHRVRAAHRLERRRRGDPARAVPRALRTRRAAGGRRWSGCAFADDVVQPDQRHPRQRASRAEPRRAARRVGLRRPGRERLVRHAQRGQLTGGRARRRDAGTAP